jgi:hypothetical protein
MKFGTQKYYHVFKGVGTGYRGITKFKLTYYFVFGFTNVLFNKFISPPAPVQDQCQKAINCSF